MKLFKAVGLSRLRNIVRYSAILILISALFHGTSEFFIEGTAEDVGFLVEFFQLKSLLVTIVFAPALETLLFQVLVIMLLTRAKIFPNIVVLTVSAAFFSWAHFVEIEMSVEYILNLFPKFMAGLLLAYFYTETKVKHDGLNAFVDTLCIHMVHNAFIVSLVAVTYYSSNGV